MGLWGTLCKPEGLSFVFFFVFSASGSGTEEEDELYSIIEKPLEESETPSKTKEQPRAMDFLEEEEDEEIEQMEVRCLSISLDSIYLFIYLSKFFYLSIYLFIYLSIYLSIYLPSYYLL